jgi:hypothetical protein
MSSEIRRSDRRLVLLVGTLAAGIFAATLVGTQLLAASAQSTNQDAGNLTDSKPTVSTTGTATAKVQPDKFTVTVGVETNGTTAQEAASNNANVTAAVIDALKALGIAEGDISTSSYSLYPVYGNRGPAEACILIYPPPPECQGMEGIIGYKASSSISVTLDAGGNVEPGEVIDTAIEAGANTVNGAFFFLSQEKQEEIRDGLIPSAIANARHRADAAAEAVGMQVSGIQSINLSDVHFPVFSRGVELQAANTQILPGEQEVSMTVSVVYNLSDGGS